MTPDDALERELQRLTPWPVSPELRRRIGRDLGRQRRLRFATGIVAAAVAAGVVVTVVLRRPPHRTVEPRPAAEIVVSPSVLAYERAFAKSPADLDALLDAQAVHTSRDVTPLHAGVASNLLALKGSSE
ncbi:MAG TPA: hypothetical protein VH120_00860 [Gemmataceae bacterium]|nr:hypothetical protein [Gemmataceae bacterium]